jgi:hypothetical protein
MQNSISPYLFMTLALPSLLLHCAAGNAQGDKPADDYLPLKTGNRWVYRSGMEQIVAEIIKEEKIGKWDCYRLETKLASSVQVEYLTSQADGFARVKIDKDGVLDPPFLFLKLPFKKDQSWKVDSKVGDSIVFGTFSAREEEVSVSAGIFKTIKVFSNDLTIRGTRISISTWFAPRMGMVKQQVEINGVEIVLELEQFSPAP